MNMPMPMPFSLQLSQSRRFPIPLVLRRALICCMAALISALLLWILPAVWRTDAEAQRNDARSGMQKTVSLLTSAREMEIARKARAKRFALVKAALENTLPGKSEWEELSRQIEAHPHIVEPTLSAQPDQPAFPTSEHLPVITLQRVRIETGLLHEEALLALDAIVTGSPGHVIPTGCSLQRETDAAPVTLRVNCEFDWITLSPK